VLNSHLRYSYDTLNMFAAVELEEADDSLFEGRTLSLCASSTDCSQCGRILACHTRKHLLVKPAGAQRSGMSFSERAEHMQNMYRSLLEKAPEDPALLLRLSAALVGFLVTVEQVLTTTAESLLGHQRRCSRAPRGRAVYTAGHATSQCGHAAAQPGHILLATGTLIAPGAW
jgi:hypothetical protein